MKAPSFPNPPTAMLVSTWLAVASITTFGQTPIISSFSQNGELACTNLQPFSTANVEWAPSALGPWTNNWAGLGAVAVDVNGMLRVSVPMFYRVRGVARGSNTVPAGMALIPAGSFTMGDNLDGTTAALPLHTVDVSAFYMDKTEVTKSLWDEVYSWALTYGYTFDNPGSGKALNHPVQTISWYDMVKWCNARSEKEGKAPAYYTSAAQTIVYRYGRVDVDNASVKWNSGYRLPTEAEWEKAARGGASGHRFPWSDIFTIQHSRANYNGSASFAYDTSPTRGYHPDFQTGGTYTSPAGYFAPNDFGLHDMAGNVTEWCWDVTGGYASASQIDPRGPSSVGDRVLRGGSFFDSAVLCRAASRSTANRSAGLNWVGFRSVLPAGQ